MANAISRTTCREGLPQAALCNSMWEGTYLAVVSQSLPLMLVASLLVSFQPESVPGGLRELMQHMLLGRHNNLLGRVRAYVHWHLHSKHKRSMYKPAPYLTHQSCPYQLELLRIQTQHNIHIIPSQLHYAF